MKTQIIPQEHQALIENALQKSLGKTTWDNIAPITRGMSGASIYKIEIDRHFYVARISNQTNWAGAHKTEFTNIQIASNAEVSPTVYLADADAGIILMKFIDNHPLERLAAGNKNDAQSLAKLVSRVHHCSAFLSGPSFFQVAKGLVEQLKYQHPLCEKAGELLESIEPYFFDPKERRPSHRDINPYNLLFDGNDYYLVDWEAAAEDTLYLDLATCVNYYFYHSRDATQTFLEAYFGKPLTADQQAKLHLMRIGCYIYAGIGFLTMASRSIPEVASGDDLPSYEEFMKLIGHSKSLADPVVQQEYGLVCLQQMLKLAEDPECCFINTVKRPK